MPAEQVHHHASDREVEDVIGKLFWEGPFFAQLPALQQQMREGIAKAARGELVRFEDLQVRLTLPERDLGPLPVAMEPAGPNHAIGTDVDLPFAGTWKLEVLATRGQNELVRFAGTVESPAQLAELRRSIRGFMRLHDVDEADAQDVVLAISEATANAIEHGHAGAEAPVEVTLAIRDGRLTGSIRDEGTWKAPHGDPNRGRGLAIMRAIAEDVSITHGDGTTVVFQRALHRNGHG